MFLFPLVSEPSWSMPGAEAGVVRLGKMKRVVVVVAPTLVDDL